MNKILITLLILFTTIFAEAQTDGSSAIAVAAPVDGQLGSMTKREYVAKDSISSFIIPLTQGGIGKASIRTVIRNGVLTSIKQGSKTYTISNINVGGDITQYLNILDSNLEDVTLTVKWASYGDGYLALRQEAEMSCFDDTYSIYYTKVVAVDHYSIELKTPENVCMGADVELPIEFGCDQEWEDGQSLTLWLNIPGVDYTSTITKATDGVVYDNVIKKYKYTIKIPTTADFSTDDRNIAELMSATVVMENGGNKVSLRRGIEIIGEDQVWYHVKAIPTEVTILHNRKSTDGNKWIGDWTTNVHTILEGGTSEYKIVVDQSRSFTWDVLDDTNSSVVGTACTITSPSYKTAGGYWSVSVNWLDAAASDALTGRNYTIIVTEEESCAKTASYGPVTVKDNNFSAELSIHGYATNTIPEVDLNDQTKIPCVKLEEFESNGVKSYKAVVYFDLKVSGGIWPWDYRYMVGIKYDDQEVVDNGSTLSFTEPTDDEMKTLSGGWATNKKVNTVDEIQVRVDSEVAKGDGYAYIWIWVKLVNDRYGTIINNPGEMKRVAIIKQLPDTSEITIN